MDDLTFSLSKETRAHHPYRSLYAALLFQGFQDALAEAMPDDSGGGRNEAAPQTRRAVPAGRYSSPAPQA